MQAAHSVNLGCGQYLAGCNAQCPTNSIVLATPLMVTIQMWPLRTMLAGLDRETPQLKSLTINSNMRTSF